MADDRATQADPAYLRIENLSKAFGATLAVDGVSLDIGKGQIFALLGSSGCGKSTLLRMLAGFERPTSGRILVGGNDVTALPPYERPFNMMFQSYALFPHLSVWENIAFGLKRMGMPKADIAVRVGRMLDLVQLKSFAERKPAQLSGGQQQRVALARSLARNPQLLLLDEPLGALDKKLRQQTQLELVKIIESVGVTCVMVTHDQEEAMVMASRMAVMSHGKILQVGTPAEIYEAPNCRFVADFIGDVNIFEGTSAGSSGLETPHGALQLAQALPDAPGASLMLAVRPEKIGIGPRAPAATANVLQGTVREIAYLGSVSSYAVALPGGMLLKVTDVNGTRDHEAAIHHGDAVSCWWNPDDGVVLRA